MEPAAWLWIPVTIWAALAQTLRNTAQRHLTGELGTLGATLVRFLYGLPFALAWLAAMQAWTGAALPATSPAFFGWVTLGGIAQIAATAFLLRVMQERNFALGVAYSKTELIQIAIFGLVVLGDPVGAGTALAVACGTLGVLLLSPADRERPLRALVTGWATRSALIGLASGASFALSVIGYRAAALSLEGSSFLVTAALTLAVAQFIQTALLGGWLAARSPQVVRAVVRLWRPSLFAGCMGAAASAGWFTAFAIEPAAHVRTLGLVELLFAYAVSRRLFREKFTALELAGIALLVVGLLVITGGAAAAGDEALRTVRARYAEVGNAIAGKKLQRLHLEATRMVPAVGPQTRRADYFHDGRILHQLVVRYDVAAGAEVHEEIVWSDGRPVFYFSRERFADRCEGLEELRIYWEAGTAFRVARTSGVTAEARRDDAGCAARPPNRTQVRAEPDAVDRKVIAALAKREAAHRELLAVALAGAAEAELQKRFAAAEGI